MPAISVQGAFDGGGPQIGNSGNTNHRWELTNMTSRTHGTHTIKWGGRLRQTFLDDTSVNNFGGSFTFLGGSGPQLDANNQTIPNTKIDLSALEVYRRTLLFTQDGLSPALIRQYGGGATQVRLDAGAAGVRVNQFALLLFRN